MTSLVPSLILATFAAAPTLAPHPGALTVFHCDFSGQWDANYDGWPDHWQRARGTAYPSYLKIEIVREPSNNDDHCLRIGLDGGAAAVYTPPIAIHWPFGYVLEAYVKTHELQHDVAYLSVTFLDERHAPLATFSSEHLRDAVEWRKVRLGPVIPPAGRARWAQIGLHLRPGEHEDLTGAALFDDIWLGRVPQINLRTDRLPSLYAPNDSIEVTCDVSVMSQQDPRLSLELIDVSGRTVDHWVAAVPRPIEPAPLHTRNGEPPVEGRAGIEPDEAQHDAYLGSLSWHTRIRENGFYRVVASMRGPDGSMRRQTVNLVVIEPVPNGRAGDFGWSLRNGEYPLPVQSLAGLLGQVGINWVKFPVWYSEKERDRADRLAWFAERLSHDGIELVAMLDQPPADVRQRFGHGERLGAAAVLSDPKLWQPLLDPVVTRLSLKLRWWQLGHDGDTSYLGNANRMQKIEQIKNYLGRFGQTIRLGISWSRTAEVPVALEAPWDYVSVLDMPGLADSAIARGFSGDQSAKTERWVTLHPLPAAEYTLEARAQDLARRMLSAKLDGASRIFIGDPFSARHGLMMEDGMPGELLLPWRTTAMMLSGTRPVGSMKLASGSQNHILLRDNEAIMVVWNDKEVRETIYLGDHVRHVDLWGRESAVTHEGGRQVIAIGPLPTFLTGLNPSVVK